jgi:AcrR family transcriptional regulator
VSDEEILEAARACLLAQGPAVSVATIAQRVGVSGPAVLKRFGSKEQLVNRALLSESPPDLSQGPEPGPLRPQLVAILLRTERLLLNAAPRLATMRAGGVQGSQWLDRPHPRRARENLLAWLKKARTTHHLAHPDLEAAADLLISLVEARGFLAWVDPSWVKPGRAWASRAVDAMFADLQPARLPVRSGPRQGRRKAGAANVFLAGLAFVLLVGGGTPAAAPGSQEPIDFDDERLGAGRSSFAG